MPRLAVEQEKRALALQWQVALDNYPTAMAFTPEGDRIVVGTGGGELVLVDSQTGAELWRKIAHPGGVLSVAMSAERIASSGQDGVARIFSQSGDCLHTLPGNPSGAPWVEHVRWSPDGQRLATAAGKLGRIWNHDGTPFLETHVHESTITALQWSRTGSELATACYGGAYLWKVESGANPRHLPFRGSLISLAWSPDEKVVACGSQDCSVHFWRLNNGKDSEMTGFPFKPKALAWDANSSMLATGGDATVCVWDFAGKGPEGSRPIQLASHKAHVTQLMFHSRKALLASAAEDMGIIVWEPRKGVAPVGFAFLEDTPALLQWHPRELCVVAADESGKIVCWRIPRD